MNLVSMIDDMISKAKNIFDRNYKDKKDTTALKALDSQRGIIDLLVKISTHLHETKLMELQLMKQQDSSHKEQEAQDRAQK